MIGSVITISAKLQKTLCSTVSDVSDENYLNMLQKEYPVPCPDKTGGPYELLHRKATGLPDNYLMAGSAWWSPASILKSDLGGLGLLNNNSHTYQCTKQVIS